MLIIGDTGAPPLFSFHCTNYNTSILNCFMHYVKYNARIPGTSVHPHEGCRTAVRGLSQPLKSSTAVPVHQSKTASHSHCFIALLIAS